MQKFRGVLIALAIIAFFAGVFYVRSQQSIDGLVLSARVDAPRLQNDVCRGQGKMWDEKSHSCQTEIEIGDRRAKEFGFDRISGATAFQSGDHFWVSPTEVFGQLHEYIVTEDGSIADSTGVIVSASVALEYFVDVSGPNGTPWFRTQVLRTSAGTFTFFNIIPGHAGWIRK